MIRFGTPTPRSLVKFGPALVLSTVAIVVTAAGATAANFAVLSDHGSLHGQTNFGGIAPAADKHLEQTSDGATPEVTPDPGRKPGNHTGAREHRHNQVAGVPAPWASEDGEAFEDNGDAGSDDNVAIPTSNRTALTLTPLPPAVEEEETTPAPKPSATKKKHTKTPKATPKPSKTETPSEDENEDEGSETEIDDD
ncbi:MAG: hypothetical protein RIS43_342 [Actinomycetota bacterium]